MSSETDPASSPELSLDAKMNISNASTDGDSAGAGDGSGTAATDNVPDAGKPPDTPSDAKAAKPGDGSKKSASFSRPFADLLEADLGGIMSDAAKDEVQQKLAEVVKSTISGIGGKKGSPNISSTVLTPEQWEHLFELTGLYQGYDIDESHPSQSVEPLFTRPEKGAEKPTFLPVDKMTIAVETTQTERKRFYVESGFTSADMSITVPYVAASIKAETMEKRANKQANRTVYFTAKAEFPRCRVDIRSCVERGYLKINPKFVERVKEIWKELKKAEKDLGVNELDGEADFLPDEKLDRRWRLVQMDDGNSAEAVKEAGELAGQRKTELDRARERQDVEIGALRRSVYRQMKDLLKRYGAVWVEQITLGGQIYSTRKEELSWETSTEEKAESIKTSLKAANAGGAGAEIGAMFGTAQKSGRDRGRASNQVSHQAIGGDTLLYNADDSADWLDSVKDPDHWRGIRFKGLKMLDQLPGLEDETVEYEGGTYTLREVLSRLLKVVAAVAKYEENIAKVPRRTLGAAWVNDLKGHWYGCYTWHKSLTQIPAPVVVTMTIGKPEVKMFTAATTGVESAYLHQLTIEGGGTDDKGNFTMVGKVVELESKIERSKSTPYELLAVVEMRKIYAKTSRGGDWHGAKTLKYATEQVEMDSGETGCFARFCQPGCRGIQTRRLVMTDQTLKPKGFVPSSKNRPEVGKDEVDLLGLEQGLRQGPHDLRISEEGFVPGSSHRSEQGLLQHSNERSDQGVDPVSDATGVRFGPEQVANQGLEQGQRTSARVNKIKVPEEEWVYRGHLDRTGMHGYWVYKGPTAASPGAQEMEFAQEGGTWTMAPVDALPQNDEVFVVEVRMPHIPDQKKGPEKLPVRLPDLGKELKELLKLPPCWSLCVGSKETGRDIDGSLRPLPDDRTLGSVLTERQLEDPRGRVYLAVSEESAPASPTKPHPISSVAKPPHQAPWTFTELEAAINEPRRRWLLPPNEDFPPGGLQGDRPLSTERFIGAWQGYAVEDAQPQHLAALDSQVRVDPADKKEMKRKKRARKMKGHVLPPPSWVNIKTCKLTGGSVGSLRYLFTGRLRQVGVGRNGLPPWFGLGCRLEGTMVQVPNARPRDEDAKHSYPILAKVEVIGTPTLFGVPIPFRRQHFWKGHLDYLGIHGFSGRVGKAELRGTFGLMPVQADLAGRQKIKEALDDEEKRKELLEMTASRQVRCWPFRRRVEEEVYA